MLTGLNPHAKSFSWMRYTQMTSKVGNMPRLRTLEKARGFELFLKFFVYISGWGVN
jgi:hypothetical protein